MSRNLNQNQKFEDEEVREQTVKHVRVPTKSARRGEGCPITGARFQFQRGGGSELGVRGLCLIGISNGIHSFPNSTL